MIQVPDLHISNQSKFQANQAVVGIEGYGEFSVKGKVNCDPTSEWPLLDSLDITVNLLDGFNCIVAAISIEQISTIGKVIPNVFITGGCKIFFEGNRPNPPGRFWLMAADNKGSGTKSATPDIVSLILYSTDGTYVFHGTGPVIKGDISVTEADL